ncbi:MAG TPA: O-acetyl-ADP-ribose deacetylase [Longimicrobiaceae bacterium]|nr:O-acetyl-ADP-ribose deacetylase [Longimicrobiaceae bacterium]
MNSSASPSPCERVEVVEGDITKLAVDAVVNAANSSLLGGGGVDGAIHRAAGPGLLEECRRLGGCRTGEAKITGGHGLPARHVIHTVGPVWQGGGAGEDELLARCYRSSLQLAVDHGLRTVAFPAISTGVYRFPVERAAEIAVGEVLAFLDRDSTVKSVLLVAFGAESRRSLLTALRAKCI